MATSITKSFGSFSRNVGLQQLSRPLIIFNFALPNRKCFSTTEIRNDKDKLQKKKKEKIVIIGSGWGGYKFLQRISGTAFEIVVVSPRNYFLFTPLLASTSVGTLEFRSIVEPVRSAFDGETKLWGSIHQRLFKKRGIDAVQESHEGLGYHEAFVSSIDLQKQELSCVSSLSDETPFTLSYDKLILACGAVTNTFGIPGVEENALFLKDIQDAKKIRYRILEVFEQAQYIYDTFAMDGKLTAQHEEKIKQLLHFVVVGGGATGVEFSAELSDFIEEDLVRMFPELASRVEMSLVDVAPTILSAFDVSLSEYTTSKFSREGIAVRTGTAVERVEPTKLIIKNGDPIPFGMCVWSTGLKQNPLLDNIKGGAKGTTVDVIREKKSGRLLTDGYFRVLENREGSPVPCPNVFALGDCATIVGKDLPCTAQVAKGKGKFLADHLNMEVSKGIKIDSLPAFAYRDLGTMAYVGDWKAIVGMPLDKGGSKKWNESGFVAWLLWRSAYFTFTVSWRNKALIPMYWMLTWIYGRDMTHIK